MPTPYSPSLRRAILSGAIVPAAIATSAQAATVIWSGDPGGYTLNQSPTFFEGLREGFFNAADEEVLPATSAASGPNNGQGFGVSLNLRMTTTRAVGAFDWADNRTWVYSGEVFTGPNGLISFAANNDDNDYLKINGAVVLNNNTWNVPNATVITNLPVNSWVPFEFRVGNGGGGAGPSGENPAGSGGWTQTLGTVMSYNDEASSLVAGNYIGGTNDLGTPTEVANGTPELFRYSIGGAGNDDVRVLQSSTVTIEGTGTLIQEATLSFEGGANPITLTLNNADATVRTLGSNITGLATANGAMTSIVGSAHLRLGAVSDGSFTGVILSKDGGTGDLILDNATNDLNGTTLRVTDGRLSLEGNGFNPVSSLAAPIEVNGTGAKLRFGGTGPSLVSATFSASVIFNDSGTLEHVSNRTDRVTGSVTIGNGITMNADIAAGNLRLQGGATGGNIVKTGPGTLVVAGFTSLENVSVNAGRLALEGDTQLASTPVIGVGGTLALTGSGVTYTIPGPLQVPSGGTLQAFPSAIGTLATNLTGGTLVLDAPRGLLGEFFGVAPLNVGNRIENWGPDTVVQGVGSPAGNTPGSGTFATFQSTFDSLGAPTVTAVTSLNGNENFDFSNTNFGNGSPFSVLGFNAADNIQARFTGKIFIPTTGLYSFSTESDDGSQIYIDGASVVDNNNFQGAVTLTGSVFLSAGLHDFVGGFYEGTGGAGLRYFMTNPGGSSQLLTNENLFPNDTPAAFTTPINVSADSTIQTAYLSATATEITLQANVKLTTTGFGLTVASLKLPAAGVYNIETSGNNIFTASAIDDGAAAVTINKSGTGTFVLDKPTVAQLTNASSQINISAGTLGLVLESGGFSPTGAATIGFNGGGLALSAKENNQTYPLPPTFQGNPLIEARKLGSGGAGFNVNLGGDLNVPTNQTLSLRTSDAYTLSVGGTANTAGGAGTVAVTNGEVISTTNTALTGLNVSVSAPGLSTATLNFRSPAPSIASLSGVGEGSGEVSLGDGVSNTTLTIDQATDTTYNGGFFQEGASIGSVVKRGAGNLTLTGLKSTYTGGLTIEAGTVSVRGAALGAGPLTLAGGTLVSTEPAGLLGEYWGPTKGGSVGANAGYSGGLTQFDAYFAGKGAPDVSARTTTNGRADLKFSDGVGIEGGGPDTATFTDQGFGEFNDMAVRFSGVFWASVDGSYTFTTRSDDGSVLFIDGVKVVNNNFDQGMTTRFGTLDLSAGPHAISVGHYEGNGGSGLEVRYTPPGGVDQFLPNSLLGGLRSNNPVNLTATSTIDPSLGVIEFGAFTPTAGATLNTLGGTLSFTGTSLNAAGTYTINKSGSGVLSLGTITDNGAAVTIQKLGDGELLLPEPASAQLQNAGSRLQVDAGGLVAIVGGTNGPLGNSTVQLAAGTSLTFSSTQPTVNVSPVLQIAGSATLAAGNRGFGAINDASVTIDPELTVTSGNSLTFRTTNGYTMSLNSITGGGAAAFTAGTINLNGQLIVSNVIVSGTPVGAATYGTTVAANEPITTPTVAVQSGGVLRQAANITGAGGAAAAVSVAANAELQSSATLNADVTLNGGLFRAQTGITDMGNRSITAAPRTITSDALRGVLHITGVEGGGLVMEGNTDSGILRTQLRAPESAAPLTGGLNFANDAAFQGLFANPALPGTRFTAGFLGNFTATENGVFEFQLFGVDDAGGFWVDLNRNGIFESVGSAGSELLSTRNCCGDGNLGTATLVAGTTYGVAIAVEDNNGGSGLSARFKRPSDLAQVAVTPNDANQVGLWSFADPNTGGGVVVEAGSELRAGRVNGVSVVTLVGDAAKLSVSNTSVVTDAVEALTAIAPLGTGTLEVGANNTMNVANLSVAPDTTLIKMGDGAVNVAAQSLGAGATLRVDDGLVTLSGLVNAFNSDIQGTANSGGLLINDGGIVNVNGAISGAVQVNANGRLGGTGTVGATTVTAGTIAPGVEIGTLNTGTLTLDATSNIAFQLAAPGAVGGGVNDLLVVTGDLTLGGFAQILEVAGFGEGTYRLINYTGALGGVLSLEAAFLATWQGSFIDTSVANEVSLVVVPEPGSLAALIGGTALLVGLRRQRRRSA